MKDFYFVGGDFLSYKDTCEAIKRFGVVPEENPAEHLIQRVQALITRCMEHYVPRPKELILRGVYLYRENEQAADLRDTFGYTLDINGNDALIGLSYGLLQYQMPVFHDLVFLHECCHLAEMNHGEEFQNRFNEVAFDYYFYHDVRMDSTAVPKPKRKGWKM